MSMDLPDELLEGILMRTPLQDLGDLCSTNQRLAALCHDRLTLTRVVNALPLQQANADYYFLLQRANSPLQGRLLTALISRLGLHVVYLKSLSPIGLYALFKNSLKPDIYSVYDAFDDDVSKGELMVFFGAKLPPGLLIYLRRKSRAPERFGLDTIRLILRRRDPGTLSFGYIWDGSTPLTAYSQESKRYFSLQAMLEYSLEFPAPSAKGDNKPNRAAAASFNLDLLVLLLCYGYKLPKDKVVLTRINTIKKSMRGKSIGIGIAKPSIDAWREERAALKRGEVLLAFLMEIKAYLNRGMSTWPYYLLASKRVELAPSQWEAKYQKDFGDVIRSATNIAGITGVEPQIAYRSRYLTPKLTFIVGDKATSILAPYDFGRGLLIALLLIGGESKLTALEFNWGSHITEADMILGLYDLVPLLNRCPDILYYKDKVVSVDRLLPLRRYLVTLIYKSKHIRVQQSSLESIKGMDVIRRLVPELLINIQQIVDL